MDPAQTAQGFTDTSVINGIEVKKNTLVLFSSETRFYTIACRIIP